MFMLNRFQSNIDITDSDVRVCTKNWQSNIDITDSGWIIFGLDLHPGL